MTVRERNGIVVVIAHRPAALAGVDRMLVMREGRMAAFGPRDEVLASFSAADGERHGGGRPGRRAQAGETCPLLRGGSLRMTDFAIRDRLSQRHAVRMHLRTSLVLSAVLGGGLIVWAASAQITGAVIAPGSLVVDTSVKKVQHQTGGIVGEIAVRDGSHVDAGEVVVRLDDTIPRANLAIVTKSLDEVLPARKARLDAERDGAPLVVFPQELTGPRADRAVSPGDRRGTGSCSGRGARRAAGQKAQLQERIAAT